MNADRLLALYDRVAEAPDAVSRLRRFVLDLAVRGKLVDQDPADKPASELLKRIAAEKSQLVKAGVIRTPRAVAPLSSDEIPFSVPKGWAWTQIAELGVISPRNKAPDDHVASFVPMSMIAAEYGVANDHTPRLWGEIKKGYTHFAEGDVGLAKITPCFENGKSTVFQNLTGGIGGGTTELHVVRPVFVNADYIVLFVKSPHFIETGIPKMTGTAGQKRVPADYFTSSPFPLPPLAEQRRIVAKVDELMGLCDRLETARTIREATRDRLTAASLARLTAPGADADTLRTHARFAIDALPALTTRSDQIHAVRQTILNLAVRGKLVEQDPADEPGSDLLKRIAAEKARPLKLGKLKKDVTVSLDDLPFSIPQHWQPTNLNNVLEELQTGPFGSSLHQSDYCISGTPVINPASIQNEKIVAIAKMAVGFSTLERLASFKLRSGDIVMARRGDMGRCALVTDREAGWLCGTGSLILRPSKLMCARFLVLLIGSPFGRQYLGDTAVGSTMQNLNQAILLNLAFGLPPLAEQRRIVAKVDELMALCDRLEGKVYEADTIRRCLLDALLHESLQDEDLASVAEAVGAVV